MRLRDALAPTDAPIHYNDEGDIVDRRYVTGNVLVTMHNDGVKSSYDKQRKRELEP